MPASHAMEALEALSAFGEASQHGRLIQLSFPREDGPESALLPNTLTAYEAVSRCFRFDVEVLSDDARIPLKALIARMVTISLVRNDGSLRYFNGYVTEFRFLRTDGGFAFYHMVLEPWMAFTRLHKDSVSFHGKSVIELTTAILANYRQADWKPLLTTEDPQLSCANQHNETDYNHLHRRWEALGLHYWYEHTAQGHTLYLSDRSTLAEPVDGEDPDFPGEMVFSAPRGSVADDGIREWTAVRRIGPGSVTLASFDYKRPAAQRKGAASLQEQGDVFPYEIYENTGEYGFKNPDDGEKQARRRMDELEGAKQYFEARGNDRWAHPGRSFKLMDHFSAEPQAPLPGEAPRGSIGNRKYFILSVEHEASNNYLTGANGASNYENQFTCVRRDIQWRPGPSFNSEPCTYPGIQTALVVGPEGASIHTDGYGRVKIQFHWDRIGTYNENSSPWIRVMSPGAGDQFGQIRLPRVGEEVAVLYLDGNIDHPVILGSVYNNRHMPPWKLPEQKALSGMRSRELTPASVRGNHLVMDDTPGKIQAQLKSDHQHSQLSLGHIARIEDTSGRKDARGEGWELRTDGHGVARAARGMLITTEPRPAARGGMKGMDETTARLSNATTQHDVLVDLAQRNGAQDGVHDQGDVVVSLQAQLNEINSAPDVETSSSELTSPHLVLASPAGIAATTGGNLHLSSETHAAITAGKHVSIASGGSVFASIRQAFRVFVQKAGLKMVAAAGDIELQALTDGLKLLAKLEITATANRISINAKNEVIINGGGSYASFSAVGIEFGTNNTFVAHASKHHFMGPKAVKMFQQLPPTEEIVRKGQGVFHLGSHPEASGRTSAEFPFKLFRDGSVIQEGLTDHKGNIVFEHELDSKSQYKVRLPTGQTFLIDPTDCCERQEISPGPGFHGYLNPGGSLNDTPRVVDQDRLDANPGTLTAERTSSKG